MTLDYLGARQLLARCLEQDALLHSQASHEIGRDFDRLDAEIPRDDPTIALAIAFWDAWIDERNHQFPGYYDGIGMNDWPILARELAAALLTNTPVNDQRLLRHFKFSRSGGIQRLLNRFRSWWRNR